MLIHLVTIFCSVFSQTTVTASCYESSLSLHISLSPLCADTELQLRRDAIFCQALVGALCTLAEQLVWALNLRYNNNGEYEDDCKEVSHKWLEQISAIGVLFNFQSTLSPHVVSHTSHSTP